MSEAVIIISALAICFSTIALILGCVAIAMVSGFLRSTHTIQWKTLEDSTPYLEDPLEEEVPLENPLKKKPKTSEDYKFMDDVTDQSNF